MKFKKVSLNHFYFNTFSLFINDSLVVWKNGLIDNECYNKTQLSKKVVLWSDIILYTNKIWSWYERKKNFKSGEEI